MGETCVPQNPQRVVTIFHGTLGNALSFGVKPIASSILDIQYPFPAYLKNQVDGIEKVGSQNAPSLERILMLKPDLILVWQNIKAIYPLLAKISPTVIVPWRGSSAWREHLEFIAKTLGKEQESQQAWKQYYQRVDQLKLALNNRYQDKEISVVSPSSSFGFFIQAKNSFAGSILNDIGLHRPKLQDIDTSSGYITFSSEEKLEMIDGDILFMLALTDKDKQFSEEILNRPLGRRLKAIKQKHVYFVDGLTWNGSNLLAANAILDDLEKYLVNIP
jgi:iron complex transport system substrate-binding protein